MVEEETRRFRPTKNYLEHLPALKLNAFEVLRMISSNIFTQYYRDSIVNNFSRLI